MLVVSRRPGESIIIYTDEGIVATIDVLEGRGNQIRLGITAKMSVHIDRQEIYLRKQAEKTTA